MSKRDEITKWFFQQCRRCGDAPVWRYGNAAWLSLCRECYREDDFIMRSEILTQIERIPYSRVRNLEYDRLIRAHYREKREKKSIVEPILKCTSCKRQLPILEFIPNHLGPLLCHDCASMKKDTFFCSLCRKKKEREDFPGGQDMEAASFVACLPCRSKINARKKEEELKYFNFVSKKVAKASLKRRGIKETQENIELISNKILASRINYKLKERIRHESDNGNVS